MIALRPESREVVLSADASIGHAPRMTASARRMIFCGGCGEILLVEMDQDVAQTSEKSLLEAMNLYDPAGDARVARGGGATILTTNRHLSRTAPQSRQCSAGRLWSGSSTQGVYATLWTEVLRWLGNQPSWMRQRRQWEKQEDPPLPEGIEEVFGSRELRSERPIQPIRRHEVYDLEGVHRESPEDGPEDGPKEAGFTLSPNLLRRRFGGPLAPEKLVSRLGGRDRRQPPRTAFPKVWKYATLTRS